MGSILFPDVPASRLRIPHAIFDAINLARTFDPHSPLTDHWVALANFKMLLDMDSREVALDRFLDDIRIVTASRIGLDIDPADDTKFFPIPFAGNGDEKEDQDIDLAVLAGGQLKAFQQAVLTRGAKPAYRVSDGTFLVVDHSAMPVLKVVARAMSGDADTREYFLQNATRMIAEEIEAEFRTSGKINDIMSPEAQTDLVERALGDGWTETGMWSDRVTGVGLTPSVPTEIGTGSGLPWLPATLDPTIGELLGKIPDDEIADVLNAIRAAIIAGIGFVTHEVGDIPVSGDTMEALARKLASLRDGAAESESLPADAYLPIVSENFWDVEFTAGATPRVASDLNFPASVTTELREYQTAAFNWQVRAWTSGLPGVLNADEQGLGKTIQTLSFLTWLTERMKSGDAVPKPILIVAPTSLLLNWEDEITQHLSRSALRRLHKLYGPHLSVWREAGYKGRDIFDGTEHLDLSPLQGTTDVIITTYQTLTNYAVSFAKLPFGVVVFDEMQFIKNPRTQRARAAKSVHAAFIIGLTGTPVENATRDIWAIVDVISPGALGTLSGFRRLFDQPISTRLAQLRDALFLGHGGRPQLCQRRLKEDVAPELPAKVRLLYPREMPQAQAIRYDEARAKTGGILQILHHIRRMSAHPGLIEGEMAGGFSAASARTGAVMDILHHIHKKNERVLIFVENRDIQSWLAELIKMEFSLSEVMVINGDTSIDDRKVIKDRFQRHLKDDKGFDVLILGPRAAGTGLTLTAANHVIHLTRWWNPAVEEQCNDRTHRIGQTRPVTIHLPLAIHPDLGSGSFDCLLHRLMTGKRGLAAEILRPFSVDEDDIQKLHEAAVSGHVVDENEEPQTIDNLLEGRADLAFVQISPQIIRVNKVGTNAGVLIGIEQTQEQLSGHLTDDVDQVFLVTPTGPSKLWKGSQPLCLVQQKGIWPNFVLPV